MSIKDWKSTLTQIELDRMREARWWCRDGRSGTVPDSLINKMLHTINELLEQLGINEEINEERAKEILRLQKQEYKQFQEISELKRISADKPSHQEVERLRNVVYEQDLEIRSLKNQLKIKTLNHEACAKHANEVDEENLRLKKEAENLPEPGAIASLQKRIWQLEDELACAKKDKPIPTPERIAEMLISATVFSPAETVLARTTFLLMDNPEYRKLFLDRIRRAW